MSGESDIVVDKSGSGNGKSKEDRIQWLEEKNKTTSNDPQKKLHKEWRNRNRLKMGAIYDASEG